MNAGVHQYEDKLLDYAYGELPAHEAAAVDAHVRTCAKCSQALVQIRGVRSVFAPLPMVAAPDAGVESLLAYADQHARRAKETKQAPWRRWVFALASAAALLVVGVVAVRASDESPQHAADILIAARKDAKADSRARVPAAAQPVAAAPGQAQPREGKAEAPTWDERSAKRGGLEQAAANSVGPEPAAPVEKGDAPALASADKLADVAPAADAPAKEVAAKLNTKGMGVGGEDRAGDRGNGRASASKREQPAVGNEEATRFDDFGNAGRGVALDEAKAARRRPTDNIAGTLNDGTKAKQSMFGGTANGPGFGVSTGSSGSAESTADDKTMVQRSLDETRKQAERAAPDAVAAATPKVQQQMLPPPAQAVPSQSSPVPALRKSGSYGLPRSAPSQAVDEDSASMTESVARSDELEARRLRDQQLDVDAQLAQSRTAGNSGDRRGEVLAAVAALNAGATGYSRLEALKRACDGYEAMGEFDRAQPYCERVVAEFGGSAAARQVADRRKAQLKSPKSPAPASSKHKLETKTRDEARPAEAR